MFSYRVHGGSPASPFRNEMMDKSSQILIFWQCYRNVTIFENKTENLVSLQFINIDLD